MTTGAVLRMQHIPFYTEFPSLIVRYSKERAILLFVVSNPPRSFRL